MCEGLRGWSGFLGVQKWLKFFSVDLYKCLKIYVIYNYGSKINDSSVTLHGGVTAPLICNIVLEESEW